MTVTDRLPTIIDHNPGRNFERSVNQTIQNEPEEDLSTRKTETQVFEDDQIALMAGGESSLRLHEGVKKLTNFWRNESNRDSRTFGF